MLFALLAILISSLIFIYGMLKPSHHRNWVTGFQKLAHIEVGKDEIKIENIRDFNLETKQFSYGETTVNPNHIVRTWFMYEPFVIQPITNFKGIAHTYFVFDFSDHAPIAVSVEARREKDENYSAYKGLINKYELLYIWGTERDETVRRVVDEKNDLYMFPLKLSSTNQKKLFMQLVKSSQDLENQPRFYNSLLSNCTNELAKVANTIQKDAIPFDKALFFPGYSDSLLYKLGYFPNDVSLEQLKKNVYVSDFIKKHYKDSDFTQTLRTFLKAT